MKGYSSAFKKPKDVCWEQPVRKGRNGNAGAASGNIPVTGRLQCLSGYCPDWLLAHFCVCHAFGDITGILLLPPWALLLLPRHRCAWCPHRTDATLAWTQSTTMQCWKLSVLLSSAPAASILSPGITTKTQLWNIWSNNEFAALLLLLSTMVTAWVSGRPCS